VGQGWGAGCPRLSRLRVNH